MIARTTVYSAVLVVAAVVAIIVVATRGHTTPASSATGQTITICKVTSPPGGAGFPFNWTTGVQGPQPGFSLNDGQCTNPPLDATNLDRHEWITEVVPSGWTLTNIACNNAPTTPVSYVNIALMPNPNPGLMLPFVPGDDTVAIDLNVPNVVCTFTNTCAIGAVCSTPIPSPTPTCPPGIFCTPTPTPSPTRSPTPTPTKTPTPTPTVTPTSTPPATGAVTICKQTDPPGGTGFSFGWSSPTIHTAPFPLNGGHCVTSTGLNPGDGPYSATEISPPPAGWTLTNIVCTGGANILIGSNGVFDPGDTGVTINLSPGENITCTFTNTALCASTSGLDISTGTAGIGAVDPIWVVSSAPNSVPIPDAYGVPGDYGPWVAPSSTASNWIDPNNTGGPPPGTFPPTDPQGTYVFDTSFTAPAGAQSLTLSFKFAADNNVKFYLNNVLIPGTAVNTAWSLLHGPITYTVPNPSGTYTLSGRVVNGTGPTGLLVEGAVTCALPATPTPRPTPTMPADGWHQGDADCSGVIDPGDVTALLENAAGLPLPADCPTYQDNVNCDLDIDARDALQSLLHLADAGSLATPGGCPPIGDPVPV